MEYRTHTQVLSKRQYTRLTDMARCLSVQTTAQAGFNTVSHVTRGGGVVSCVCMTEECVYEREKNVCVHVRDLFFYIDRDKTLGRVRAWRLEGGDNKQLNPSDRRLSRENPLYESLQV